MIAGGVLGAASGALFGSGIGRVMQEAANHCIDGECTAFENATESGSTAGALLGTPTGMFVALTLLPKQSNQFQ